MEIIKRDKYSEKLLKFEEEDILTSQEVESCVKKIQDRIEKFNSARSGEKKKLQKVLDNGEEIIKTNFNKKFSIRYFYNKTENKLEIINILEYKKERVRSLFIFDIIASVYTLFISFIYMIWGKINFIELFILFIVIAALNGFTSYSYKKEGNKIYRVIGKDWLETFLLNLDSPREKVSFYISRILLLIVLMLQNSRFLNIDSGVDLINFPNSIILFFLILRTSSIFFRFMNINLYYAFSLLMITVLISGLNSNNWTGIVLMFAFVNLIFSDEIWKLNEKFENPLKGKYNSEFNEKLVERNIFKFKFTLSIMSLVLYFVLRYMEDKVRFGAFLLGDNFKNLTEQENITYLNKLSLLLLKGLDRWIIIFVILLVYSMLVCGKNKLASKGYQFEEPIIERLVQFSYKGRKIGTPVVKTEIEIDQDLQEIFEPKILIENIDELPKDIIVSMKTPVVQGSNVLFIQYADGEVLLKENVTISFKITN
ncbi:hypothetical protein B7728_05610 [Streptococcus oralis subsp. tigurinus]|jgi:membrane protein|uniref:Uncharacterized protein n=1 Tax=Streptococcus oralis subsp. tigurinus TaxID=1077464 RepID=A0A1X1FZE8_STROR|nr:hypothetical protein [Streptococcus oralis]ORO39778.1 hypothetical protein B7728_05610 [Streptococcus oralis subsp. tigurinus]